MYTGDYLCSYLNIEKYNLYGGIFGPLMYPKNSKHSVHIYGGNNYIKYKLILHEGIDR